MKHGPAFKMSVNHRVSRPERYRDLRAAKGILLAVVIGIAVLAWTVAFIRWL